MLKCEGYRMFRGAMVITPTVKTYPAFVVTGVWLYKPDTKCWYCNCTSYPEGICTLLGDEDVGH